MQREALVVGCLGVVRSKPQGGPAAVDGLLVLAQGAVNLGQVGVVSGGLGLENHGAGDQLDRPGRISVLVVQDAEEMQGTGVVGLPGKHGVIATGRVGETTRLVQLPGGGKLGIGWLCDKVQGKSPICRGLGHVARVEPATSGEPPERRR